MASLQKRVRSDGSTAYRVMFRDAQQLVGETFDDPVAAEEFRHLVQRIGAGAARAVLRARQDQVDPVLVKDWVDGHITRLTGVTDGTRKDYRALARNHITPTLGDYPIQALTRRLLEEWVNGLTGTISGKTMRNVQSLLSAALTRAVYEGLIPANLAKGIRLPRNDTRKHEMVTLTSNEFTQLLDHVPEHYRPLVVTLVGTGMRWGEATALTVGGCDLDADRPVLRITQAWKHTGLSKAELGSPKSRKGHRTISLSPSLVRTLRPLVDGRPPGAYVFTTPAGTVVDHAHFYERVWRPAVRGFAGDELVAGEWVQGPGKRPRIHDLRHTHVTWMLGAGRPVTSVQRRLGHESIQTTVDVYGHAMPDDLSGDAAAIEAALAGAVPTVDDPQGHLPASLAVAGLVADVEGGDDPGPVGRQDRADAAQASHGDS